MSYTLQPDGRYHIPIIDLGTRLRDNFDLRIREHPHFDEQVDRVHVDGSLHYSGNAIDVQDWRPDNIDGVHYLTRTGNLGKLLAGSAAEILGPHNDPEGHEDHLHLGSDDGIFRLTPQQYQTIFGGQAGGRRATFAKHSGVVTPLPEQPTTESPQQIAKSRAKAYSEMSKQELDSAYDALRESDPAKAKIEGMKMHKAFFGK